MERHFEIVVIVPGENVANMHVQYFRVPLDTSTVAVIKRDVLERYLFK